MHRCILVASRRLVAILAIREAGKFQSMLYLLQGLYQH
nr:MAG TPA: hypothetical protein [Caudoviricetes sp.]